MNDTLIACRALLAQVTPLAEDCGRLCGGACCHSMPGEETGMLLFPGEEEGYRGRPGFTLRPAEAGMLLVCSGNCDRSERPLGCRLFPLLPLLREDGVKVAMDARAATVCPLYRMGRRGLRHEFVEAVRACGQLLAEDPEQRAFLARLTGMHDDLRALRATFGPSK